jgi:hypothetical protein
MMQRHCIDRCMQRAWHDQIEHQTPMLLPSYHEFSAYSDRPRLTHNVHAMRREADAETAGENGSPCGGMGKGSGGLEAGSGPDLAHVPCLRIHCWRPAVTTRIIRCTYMLAPPLLCIGNASIDAPRAVTVRHHSATDCTIARAPDLAEQRSTLPSILLPPGCSES